jgi:peroxiredoxin
VIGVSCGSVGERAVFAGEDKLPFTLLAGGGGQVRKR